MAKKIKEINNGDEPLKDNDWLNEGIMFYQAAMKLPEYSKEQIDLLVQAADHAHPDACHILLYYIFLEKYEFPKDSPPFIHYAYLSHAADGGYLSEQYELANYYRKNGDNVKAVIYYERAYNNSVANPDDDFELMYRIWACEELATIYLKGTGIVSPYSKKLFYTKEAVYLGSVKFAADLSWLYLNGSDDGNFYLIEALIWALISKANDEESEPLFLYGMLYDVDSSFNSEQIRAIEEDAERRLFIIKGDDRFLTEADVALFYKTFEGGRYYNNVIGNAKGIDESNSVSPAIDLLKSTEPQSTTPLSKVDVENTEAVLSNHNNEDVVNSRYKDEFQEESIDTDVCPPEETTPQTNDDKGAQGNKQVPFVIADIKKLAINIYTNSDKVKLSYEDKHITLEAAKILSPNCHELLLRHDKHLNHHERAVRYYDADIYNAQNSSERSNRQIVSDFNYAFRKFFDLDKKIKPFEWIGKKADRSLKANFTLKVVYNPKK